MSNRAPAPLLTEPTVVRMSDNNFVSSDAARDKRVLLHHIDGRNKGHGFGGGGGGDKGYTMFR